MSIAFGGEHRHPNKMSCTYCGYVVDSSDFITETDPDKKVESHIPEDGDASVCLACGCINMFTDGGNGLRKPTEDELATLGNDPIVMRLVLSILAMKAVKPDWPKGTNPDVSPG